MDGTIIQQGSFISTGTSKTLSIRSDVDWMSVYNYTEINTVTGSRGVQYYWQRGLALNNGIVYIRNAGGTAVDTRSSTSLGVPGFTLIDSSIQTPGPAVALTAVSNANPPRVTTGSTATLTTGDVVRLINIAGAQQVSGIDFTITVADATHFDLTYGGAGVVTVAGTTGFWRRIPFSPLFYPSRRTILNITQAAQAVVTTSVAHGYTVGQLVRFVVPQVTAVAYGMTQLDGLLGEITAVTAGTFTVNIDTTAFTAFAFPLTANVPFTLAEVVPVGQGTDATIADPNLLDDATVNTGYLGMLLGAGITSPAGSVNDVIYWVAGKSFNV